MLTYMKAALQKIKNDLKLGIAIFEIVTMILIISYLIFALSAQVGNLITNIILLTIVSIYFILFLLNLKFKFKIFRSVIKKYYTWIRLTILATSLGITIYELYFTTSEVNPITIILVTLLLIFWILQVVVEIIYRIFLNEVDLLVQAIAQDKESALAPVKKIFKGEEEAKTKSKKILRLEKKIEKEKLKQDNKKSHPKWKFWKK